MLKDLIALNAEKRRWKFIQEVTNTEKQRTIVDTLGNSFVEFITNRNDIANLLNFKFSVLGEYFSEIKIFDKILFSADTGEANRFVFKYVTSKEVHDLIKCLNVNKLLGPSKTHSWALKDAQSVLAEPPCFLINELFLSLRFRLTLKNLWSHLFIKTGKQKIPDTIVQYQ